MSDSSENEDLSRFKDVVDNSFTRALIGQNDGTEKECKKLKSERYLDEATHYNDVKVPEAMQKRIGARLSSIIQKKYEFADVKTNEITAPEMGGGVKLFKDSNGFMSCVAEKDLSTEIHNNKSRKRKKERRQIEDSGLSEQEKIDSVTVSGDHVLSKEEIKYWKSRRKEKVFKYKSNKGSKVLIAVE